MITVKIINKHEVEELNSEYVTLNTYKEGEISIFSLHEEYNGAGFKLKATNKIIDNNFLFHINDDILHIFLY